ncbi:MAG: type II toxin-antitoxin system Phd/YefM family antitoxin [Gammaproteobacteria bacterium]|nr:type II toxin-antitoxin system Phd/YefM family antitoxin [Gammaproteobacteria bacterium]
MDYVTLADFRAQMGQMWDKVAEDGALVLTRNGKPFALITETEEAFVQEELHALCRARAELAVRSLREQFEENGGSEMNLLDINERIRAARLAGMGE